MKGVWTGHRWGLLPQQVPVYPLANTERVMGNLGHSLPSFSAPAPSAEQLLCC